MTKKRINSRQKGKTGELELAEFLRDYGHDARRGQQFKGGTDSPDVVSQSLGLFHIECKRTERSNIYAWMEQATVDSQGKRVPLIAHRRNGEDWVAILRLDDFLNLLVGLGI